MRITKRTNIAIRVLMFCAANPGRLVTKHEIADCCNASENHLAQVINQLAQIGIINTQRGRNGGMELAQSPAEVEIGSVFRAIEAPMPLTECFAAESDTCPLIEGCRLRPALEAAAEAFYARLDQVTLDELVCDNDALLSVLAPANCRKQPVAAAE